MKSRKWIALLGILVVLSTLLAGCSRGEQEAVEITDIRQLDGQRIGVMTGSTFDSYTDQFIQDARKEYYSSYADHGSGRAAGQDFRLFNGRTHGAGFVLAD